MPSYPLRMVSRAVTTAGLVAVTAGFVYAHGIEPEWLRVSRTTLTLPRLPRSFDGYRVAHVTDLHTDEWIRTQYLEQVARAINREDPDLIAITGDFVRDKPARYEPKLAPFLHALRPRDATVGVLGNHDHWTTPHVLLRILDECGVIDVSNGVHSLRRGEDNLHVAGVDSYREGKDDFGLMMRTLPPDGAAILLVHEPDFADIVLPTRRFDLQLSGHTHGGQVRLPIFGPLLLPRYGKKYPDGLYELDGVWVHTSRGVGMGTPYARFGCRPEITIFTLRTPA